MGDTIMDPLFLHGEQEIPHTELNSSIEDIFKDISYINDELCATAALAKLLMQDVKLILDDAEQTILKEKERQQDLNLLCSGYSDFGMVVSMTSDDFTGSFSSENNVFMMYYDEDNRTSISVDNISGNGFEGNKYVYKDGKFLQDAIDTSSRKFIVDGSAVTIYEYTRLTADTSETDVPPEMNFDSLDAVCVLTLSSQSNINTLKLISDSSDMKLVSMAVSDDGVIYSIVNKESYDIKSKSVKYNVDNYIPDSGIICFPDTKHVKITLQSSGYDTDTIAFYKTSIGD